MYGNRAVITVTPHQAAEWSRLAQDAYRTGRNHFGHRFSAAGACYSRAELPVPIYDALMLTYRRWLVGGWSAVEEA